jgi:hypothetical protein
MHRTLRTALTSAAEPAGLLLVLDDGEPAAGGLLGVLSAGEAEVATLAASGLTNRNRGTPVPQPEDRRYAPRTGVHKLAVRSRAELAGLLTRERG